MNGADDDGDGKYDYPQDPGCSSSDDNDEADPIYQCSDDIDNDLDGKTDFDWVTNDPGCTSMTDNDESDVTFVCKGSDPLDASMCAGDDVGLPNDNTWKSLVSACTAGTKCEFHCSAGFEYSGGMCVVSSAPPACRNGLDDDSPQDFLQDDISINAINYDPGCSGPDDTDESNVAECSDGIDNDAVNGTDYPDDPGCWGPEDNFEQTLPPPPPPTVTADVNYDMSPTKRIKSGVPFKVHMTSSGATSCTWSRTGTFPVPANFSNVALSGTSYNFNNTLTQTFTGQGIVTYRFDCHNAVSGLSGSDSVTVYIEGGTLTNPPQTLLWGVTSIDGPKGPGTSTVTGTQGEYGPTAYLIWLPSFGTTSSSYQADYCRVYRDGVAVPGSPFAGPPWRYDISSFAPIDAANPHAYRVQCRKLGSATYGPLSSTITFQGAGYANLDPSATSPANNPPVIVNPVSVTFAADVVNTGTVSTFPWEEIKGALEIDWNKTSSCSSPVADDTHEISNAWFSLAGGATLSMSKTLNAADSGLKNLGFCWRIVVDPSNIVTEYPADDSDNATGWRYAQISGLPACSDGIDNANDGDGLIDMNDPGCTDPSDTTEYNIDLKPVLMSQNPDPAPGENATITLSASILNGGNNKNSPATFARFCMDNGSCATSTVGRLGADQPVGALAPGATSTPFTRTWVVTAGAHTLYVCADVGDLAQKETDETNNCLSLPIVVAVAGGCLGETKDRCVLNSKANGETDGVCLPGDSGSCEYTCDGATGTWNPSILNTCTPPGLYSCTPVADPAHSALCTGDSAGLLGDTAKTTVNSCTNPTKCEYYCDVGYSADGTSCLTSPTASIEVCDLGGTNCVTSGNKTINVGTEIEIRWNTNADTCTGVGFNTGGSPSDTLTTVVEPPAGGSKKFSVVCDKIPALDQKQSAEVTVITSAPGPHISSDKVRVTKSDPDVTITWDTGGSLPTSCTISGPGYTYTPADDTEISGNFPQTVTARSTYTISCEGGTKIKRVTIEVESRQFDS